MPHRKNANMRHRFKPPQFGRQPNRSKPRFLAREHYLRKIRDKMSHHTEVKPQSKPEEETKE